MVSPSVAPVALAGSKLNTLKLIRNGYLTAKVNFNTQYGQLSQYFYQIKSDEQFYTPQIIQGQYQNDGNINDNVGAKAVKLMASAVMGMVWKDEGGTFRVIPSRNIPDTPEHKAYYKRSSSDLIMFLERPKSRLTQSLFKTILESDIYGTSGLVVQSGGYDNPLKFHNKSVLSFYIGYDKDGEIKELFIDYNMSAQELFDGYGAAAGPSVQQSIKANDHTKRFVVTEAIRPRLVPEAEFGRKAMPFSLDKFMPNENIMLEEDGGYMSLPMKVLFHNKLEYESYGRSPAMDALPTVVQVNIASEILAIGGELLAQPALGMYDNGSLAGLAVDLSAGALNVYNVAETVPNERPIFELFQVGDLRVIFEWYTALKEEIGGYFFLDKLYDLNNKQRMTLGEAMMRDQIRSDALSPIFTNIMSFQTEVLERSIDLVFDLGLLGVVDPEDEKDRKVIALKAHGYTPYQIPPAILAAQMAGIDWYEIQYISPAARIMNNEEMNSTLKFLSMMGEAGAINPEFLDVVDPDGTARKMMALTSTDSIVTRTQEQRDEIRKNRAQMQIEMAKVEAQAKIAQANQANAQAEASRSGAVAKLAEIGGAV